MQELPNELTDAIEVPPRLRNVNPEKVKMLAQSMEQIGLMHPIVVHQPVFDEPFHLIAGAHRLAAAKRLGWEFIDIKMLDTDEITRQLWEIDENLMRSELTPTEEAEHLAKRKELWAMKEEQKSQPIDNKQNKSGTTCPTLRGRGKKNFAAQTAGKTGVSKRAVTRAISRADNITEEARNLIRGTELDKGTYLDALKKVPMEQQVQKVQSDLNNKKPKSTQNTYAPKKIASDTKDRAAKEVAEFIVSYAPSECLDAVRANLYSAGAKNIAENLPPSAPRQTLTN